MAQRLIKQRSNYMPKLQMLIYPWIQLHNYASPSFEEYYSKTFFYDIHIEPGKFTLWYLGKTDISPEMEEQIVSMNLFYLIKDKELRKKFISMQDYHEVPAEYKQGKSYYERFEHRHLHDFDIDNELDENHILIRDKELNSLALKLLTEDMSPGLADDEIIRKLPKTYIMVCEWEVLKDQQLLFAERLKRNGVNVTVAFYEAAFHGSAFFIGETLGLQTARNMMNNMIDYIKINI
jgi:acetyl esterase/lipase